MDESDDDILTHLVDFDSLFDLADIEFVDEQILDPLGLETHENDVNDADGDFNPDRVDHGVHVVHIVLTLELLCEDRLRTTVFQIRMQCGKKSR